MKVNNKLCNVNSFEYDEENKILKVSYKIVGEKTYDNFKKEDFELICKRNDDGKTIGVLLSKSIKK